MNMNSKLAREIKTLFAKELKQADWINVLKYVLKLAGLGVIAFGLVLAFRLLNVQVETTVGPAPVVYDATGAMQDAIVYAHEARPAARHVIYDATGVRENAVVLPGELRSIAAPSIVYDATGAMQDAIVLPGEVKSADNRPVIYDATAALQDAVIFSHEVNSASHAAPYDATGAMQDAIVLPWEVD
jgi:hypothetical protein